MIRRIRQHVLAPAVVALAAAAGACGSGGGAGDTAAVTTGRLDSATLAAPPTVTAAPDTVSAPSGAAPAGTPASSGSPTTPSGSTAPRPRLGPPIRVPATVPPASSSAPDSVQGIVAVVGAVPTTSVVVRAAGVASVTVTGPLAREIAEAAGAEVAVVGSGGGRTIVATRYEVKRVDGQPVVDGTLAREGSGYALVTRAGRRALAAVPPAFATLANARVWASLDAQGNVISYGVLRR